MALAAMNTLRNSRSAFDKGLLLRHPNIHQPGSRLEESKLSGCIPVQLCNSSHSIIGHRSFSSATAREFPRPSRSLRSPRWINTRQNGRASRIDKCDTDGGAIAGGSANASNTTGHDLDSDVRLSDNEDNRGPSSSSTSSSSASNSGGGDDNDSSSSSPPPREPLPITSAISKQSVPEHYPEVLALPIARRPLFPGFYKAVVIRNPAVVAAIKEMMRRGQPYLGAFLLKDEQADSDIISDINSVHHVGVFAQITSVFSATGGAAKDGEEAKEEGLTAVLYPHRRIKLTGLMKKGDGSSAADLQDMGETSQEPITPPSSPVRPSPNSDLQHAENETSQQRSIPQSCEDISFPYIFGTDYTLHVAPLQTSFLHEYPISVVSVQNLVVQPYNKDEQYVRAVMSEIVSVFKDIAQLNPLFRDQITNFSISQVSTNVFDEPDKLADFAAAVSAGEVRELQDVLESLVIEDRLRKALLVLKKELINAQLQSKISRDVDSKIAKRQREYYLMEQLKGIKKELGMESDGKDKMIEKFKERAASLKMPDTVRKVFDEELGKLMHLEPAASEANVTRNYLEWLTQVRILPCISVPVTKLTMTQIPWGQHSPENYSIAHATKVLDEDHYGLKDVKDRILEFLAVGKLRGTVEGKIICFIGPPGVGKTSIGKSIARALNRQFFRFSVGGLTDVAEIKGHRRTYVGCVGQKRVHDFPSNGFLLVLSRVRSSRH